MPARENDATSSRQCPYKNPQILPEVGVKALFWFTEVLTENLVPSVLRPGRQE